MKVILTLPAYNEAAALPQLFAKFQQEMRAAGLDGAAVVVDDGSTDNTRGILDEWSTALGIEIVVHKQNRGLGETIRDALYRAAELSEPDDVIVTMDADNTHPPSLIPEMFRRIQAGNDLVIASRYRAGASVIGLSPLRHLMSYGARILFTAAFPIPGVRDYTSGFRAYRPVLLRNAAATYRDQFVTEKGFSCMAEILLKLSRMGPRISEVPLVLNYDQKGGQSKMKVAKTVLTTLKLLARSRFG
ncbi:MAG: glycosyltransferase [Bryobacteraceae bacterium]